MTQKKLPLGVPTFREIIQGNYLYADKTEYMNSMLKGPKFLFLSRPGRFGKTLLLDAVEELFLGNRELFRDLWIVSNSNYGFERHPVLRFDMSYDGLAAKDDLAENIKSDLTDIAETEGFTIGSSSCGRMLGEVLKGVSEKYGLGVVILVDEYDDPESSLISSRKLSSDNLDSTAKTLPLDREAERFVAIALAPLRLSL
ncbi:MAG: AAA family ATPase [Deltaproteobacteria bacterium]|nr:AAA family ATPase [Deltaproteobacteria bacterium]